MDLYREEILEHWQNPLNFGHLKDYDLEAEMVNPLCGDSIRIQIKLDDIAYPLGGIKTKSGRQPGVDRKGSDLVHLRGGNGRGEAHLGGELSDVKIEDISFTGSGCAISIASASILLENIKGKPLAQIKKLKGEDILDMVGGKEEFPPARLKCAFLALEAVKKLAISS